MATQIKSEDAFNYFINCKPYVVIHFDAEWDVHYRPLVRTSMNEAAVRYAELVAFGEIDVNQSHQICIDTGVMNVPAIGYYRNGQLFGLVISSIQNVSLNIERIMAGEIPQPK